MATKIYDTGFITLIDGTEIYLTPLKIKYLREFMDSIKILDNGENNLDNLLSSILICMKQYYPKIKTIEDLEDSIDIKSIYIILYVASGIKAGPLIDEIEDEQEEEQENGEQSKQTWENLGLAKLESEAFMLGIWKDYEELESSLSLPELMSILEEKRQADYQDKKFFAALQGVDLDEQNGAKQEVDPWEAMKARVFSGGATEDPNDILAFQGQNAAKAGFGINAGISYEKWD
jgi:hypothetical protein